MHSAFRRLNPSFPCLPSSFPRTRVRTGRNAARIAPGRDCHAGRIAAFARMTHAGAGLLLASLCAAHAHAGDFKLMGSVSAESRLFLEGARFQGQHGANGSFAVQPEFYYASADARDSVIFTPFLRADQGDSRRSHGDIRELAWTRVGDTWELRTGIRRVFWGVAESNHLVDIINQTDLVENLDTEDKLGQPMLNLALVRDWGTVDLFVLPGFRARTFPGKSGRLRADPRVDTSSATYESAAEESHVDYAVRYSHVFGNLDLGLHHFWGTSREPTLRPRRTEAGAPILAPHYPLIHQTGIDALLTLGNWSLKLEALRRSGQGDTFCALVGGFEYTFVGVFGTAWDIGALAEYHRDERDRDIPQPFNDDLFGGARWAVNDMADTQLLTGIVTDLDGGGRFFNLEFSRRFGDRWRLEAEMRVFWSAAPPDPLFWVSRDDYVQVQLSRYF
ncbi:MAG: hypothetical protein AB7R40_24660 [Nitrospiraceae bacterium]